jgi:hypothetical protein
MIELGFTGTRRGMTHEQLSSVKEIMHDFRSLSVRAHHGMCIGSDKEFHDIAKEFGFCVRGHPPINKKYVAEFTDLDEISEPRNFLNRNHDIVNESDFVIATPYQYFEILRSGTWATVRYCVLKQKKICIVMPDGEAINGFNTDKYRR